MEGEVFRVEKECDEELLERRDCGERLESDESRRVGGGVEGEGGGMGGGGSYPGCKTPIIHIGSVHLSGCASLSRR